MSNLNYTAKFILLGCLIACTPKQIPVASKAGSRVFQQFQLADVSVLPDVVVEKFDSAVKWLWTAEFSKDKNFSLIKNPEDSAVEETYLDSLDLALLRQGHTYRLRQHFQISETSNPVLPGILRKLNQGKATRAEINYSIPRPQAGNSELTESYQSEFGTANTFLSSEGHEIAPGNSAFFTDMMANAGARGYELIPLNQLKLNFSSVELTRTFVVVSLERSYTIKKKNSDDVMEISLVVNFLRNSESFASPIYRVLVEFSGNNAEDGAHTRISEELRKFLAENTFSVNKTSALAYSNQLYNQLKSLK